MELINTHRLVDRIDVLTLYIFVRIKLVKPIAMAWAIRGWKGNKSWSIWATTKTDAKHSQSIVVDEWDNRSTASPTVWRSHSYG
jgi:hypothetical protein